MIRKIEQHEAFLAVDEANGTCFGAIALSRSHNRITFFAISPKADHARTAEGLLEIALQQLDSSADIAINLPVNDHGHLCLDQQFFISNRFDTINETVADGCPMVEMIRKADNKHGGVK